MVSVNVCSLVRAGRMTLFLDFILKLNPNIVFVQETQIDSTIRFNVPGYNVLRGDIKKGWSGTAILVDANVPIRNLRITKEGIHSTSIECKFGNNWTRFASIYIPHGKATEKQIRDFFNHNKNTFFGGDTNARHTGFGDLNDNAYGIYLYNLSNTTNLTVFNPTTPTCYKAATGSFIDKFLTNTNLLPVNNIQTHETFSDHMAIQCSLPLNIPDDKIDKSQNFNYNIAPVHRINNYILTNLKRQVIPIKSNLSNDGCELLATNISNIFNDAVLKFVPTSNKGHQILISAEARSCQLAIKRHYRKLHQLGPMTPRHILQPIKNNISQLKNMLNNAISHETSKFFSNTYNSITDNRDAFRVIRRYTGYKKKESTPASLYTNEIKTDSIVGSENIANALANRFGSNNDLTINQNSNYAREVYQTITQLLGDKTTIGFNDIITPDIIDTDTLNHINEQLDPHLRGLLTCSEEVQKIIKTRPNKNASGYDLTPYTLIKSFNDEIIRGITIFFNHLLATSYFPMVWQKAIITPIPKPGKDGTIITNWRPISLLPCISKIFERIIAQRINKHTGTLNIFNNQYGFLNNNSTIHALANLQSHINYGLNNGKVTTIVALDLQAAFDTVWHSGLICKMIKLGYPILLIKITKSFLNHRSFVVRLNGFMSITKLMLAGVPQGSVLGPICFNIFTYDIPTNTGVNISQFADDTTLFITHKNPSLAQTQLNSFLFTLSTWFKNWKLKLNEGKTELIHILGQAKDTNYKLRKNTRLMKISINGHTLEHRDSIRLLGLQLQTNNRFTKNVQIRINKARGAKFTLRRLLKNKHIDTNVKTNIYKLYIRPILMYASAVWCRQPQLSSHQMEIMRNFERGVLKQTANIHRDRGSYKHVPITDIYRISNCPRLDRFAIQNQLNFFGKVCTVNRGKFKNIRRTFHSKPYQCMPRPYIKNALGKLFVNGKLLIFNRGYNNQRRLVYNTGQ